jgi:CDP-paratose 2-epimerase
VKLLVTGGAGFVGSNLATMFKRAIPGAQVIAFDNLHRRGSELALSRLAQAGVEFVHGDVRNPEDLEAVGAFDMMIECSAEPSVHAGYGGAPSYVVSTNLTGTINCLEAVRRAGAGLIFLSTSRVYPIEPLRALPLEREGDRLTIARGESGTGWSAEGIARSFPLDGYRSLYGATKLASELLIEEYRHMFGVPAIINRCGVIAGPWQMGKVDQGFVALWAARHLWADTLQYTGFGGEGLQVRDVLHVEDLFDLIELQVRQIDGLEGRTFNVGGGPGVSTSLRELTALCERRAGRSVRITGVAATAPADIPYYVTDNSEVSKATGWRPRRSLERLLDDTFDWLRRHEALLRPLLAPGGQN